MKLNAIALTALIGDLYAEVGALRLENERLRAALQQVQQPPETAPEGQPPSRPASDAS